MKRPRILNSAAQAVFRSRKAKKMKCRSVSALEDLEAAANKQRLEADPLYSIPKHIELLGEYLQAIDKRDNQCT